MNRSYFVILKTNLKNVIKKMIRLSDDPESGYCLSDKIIAFSRIILQNDSK